MSQKKIDILSICTYHGLGGAQNLSELLTSEFRMRGYNAEVLYLFEREPDYSVNKTGVSIAHSHRPRNLFDWLIFLYKCRKLIRGASSKSSIGYHPLSNIIGSIFKSKNGRFVSTQAWPAGRQGKWTQRIEDLLSSLSAVDANIAVSKFVADSFEYRGKIYKDKTKVVYNAPRELSVVNNQKDYCRRSFGMPLNGRIIGTLGRLHEQKNYQLAIRALSHSNDCHLYLAGSGDEEELLRGLAVEHGVQSRVHFLGMLSADEVATFLKSIDLMLMTSIYEGHPLAMLEAMSSGVPILAHDIPVLREAGGDAVIYASSDPLDWARVINELDEDKLRELGLKSLEVSRRFTISSMVDQYLDILGFSRYKA